MKIIYIALVFLIVIAGLGYGTLLFLELKDQIAQVQKEKKLFEQLVEIYNHTIKNPEDSIDTNSEDYINLSNYEYFESHLADIHAFITKYLENIDTLDYQGMYVQTQDHLQSAQILIEEINQDKKVEVAKQKELIDSLNNIKNSLIKRTAEKEQALNRNLQNLDSLKSVIDLYEVNKKEILHFTSSTGIDITYFGQTRNGKAHGNGIGVYANGNKYEGEWKNGKKEGEGVYQYPDGETYEGSFVEDKRKGFGLYKWPNGDVYTGYWKNDRRHGEGVIKDKSGKVLSTGIWTNDLLGKTQKVDF